MKNFILIEELNPVKKRSFVPEGIDARVYITNCRTFRYVLFANENFSLHAAAKALQDLKLGFRIHRLKNYPTLSGRRDVLIIKGRTGYEHKDYMRANKNIIEMMTYLTPKVDNEVNIINATGHLVQLLVGRKFINFPVSKTVIRCTYKTAKTFKLDGKNKVEIPIENVECDTSNCELPEYRKGTFYIVSKLTAELLKRPDLLSPDDYVFNNRGRKIACRKLITINDLSEYE